MIFYICSDLILFLLMELKLQEQDGLVFDVFHYLWLKNPMTKVSRVFTKGRSDVKHPPNHLIQSRASKILVLLKEWLSPAEAKGEA